MTAAGVTGPVAVTGQSVHLPGPGPCPPGLATPPGGPAACPAERAHELLGRKGLLGKDAATRLALCAVHQALGLPPQAARHDGPPDPGTAVVACSNLGNLGSVLDTARAVRAGGRRAVSPLAAPGASSNVIASAVSIWFRFGGPSLMVCSGATAGLDAVALGMVLLRAGRARRVVVVGSEPADPDAVELHRLRTIPVSPLRAAGACVILEPSRLASSSPRISQVSTWPGPAKAGGHLVVAGSRKRIDLSGVGDLYGAHGVALLALATRLAGRDSGPPAAVEVVCGDAADGWRSALVAPCPVVPPAESERCSHDQPVAAHVPPSGAVRPPRPGLPPRSVSRLPTAAGGRPGRA